MKTATDLALEFVKRRIPTSFRDEKEMRELCAAGKSSTYDAVIFGHTEGRREALEMAQGLMDALREHAAHLDCEDPWYSCDLIRYKEENTDGSFSCTCMAKYAIEALAKFEEWKDGK